MMDDSSCNFERLTDVGEARPTLIAGLPGLGMVGSIAVDEVTRHLDLHHHGSITSEAFPPVASFEEGRVREPVRVFAGRDPDVMTLRSGMPVPPGASRVLAGCVLGDLAEEFKRAVVLVGTPAQSDEERGEIQGIATDESLHSRLRDADIPLAEGEGLVGGPPGAILSSCHRQGIPAIGLVVKAHAQLPDPGAARALIEEALEPLVDFDIDTTDLKERDEEIKLQLQQIADQYREMLQQQPGGGEPASQPSLSMYQ